MTAILREEHTTLLFASPQNSFNQGRRRKARCGEKGAVLIYENFTAYTFGEKVVGRERGTPVLVMGKG